MSSTASTANLPCSWDVDDDELSAMGFPVQKWSVIVGCKHLARQGMSREDAERAAQRAGVLRVPLFMPTRERDRRDAARRAAKAVDPVEDAKRAAENAAWLATPGNVVGFGGVAKVR